MVEQCANGREKVAAIITCLTDQSKTTGWLWSTTVGISCEEEPMEWTAEDYHGVCDNTGKRLSPEAVQTAKAGRAGVYGQTRSS